MSISDTPRSSSEEDLRFITNFHDIFLSIGLAMLGFGLAVVSLLIMGPMIASNISNASGLWMLALVGFANAGVMWGLAEIFARKQRRTLPAMVILISFVTAILAGVTAAYLALNFDVPGLDDASSAILGGAEGLKDNDILKRLTGAAQNMPLVITGATALSIFAYYFRMRLPFAMGAGAAMTALFGAFLFTRVAGFDALAPNLIMLISGIFLFVLGLWFDARDIEREMRFSDNAFWLHFFAAPLIFFAVRNIVGGGAAILGIVLIFAVISLLINRRALLVAGLLSAVSALGGVFAGSGLDATWTMALTLLILGAAIVLLGGGWSMLRRVLIAPFPKSGPISRIIPPEIGLE